MPIKKEPFINYNLEDKNYSAEDIVFSTRLTKADKSWFIPAKKYLKQKKASTAMKQLAEIGSIVVLLDPKMAKIIDIILGNSRKNERLGLPEDEVNLTKGQHL